VPHTPTGRQLDNAELTLRTIGLDIGSSTTHFTLSTLELALVGSRYVPVNRSVLFASQILLTPYRSDDTEIDAEEIARFIAGEFDRSGTSPDEIDAGAVILTGTALAKPNSRLVADLFADEAGKFVVASAGDVLEGTLSAHGAGAADLSRRRDSQILHVDVGGGTVKLVLCRSGAIVGATALDIGARIITLDRAGRVLRVSSRGAALAGALGLEVLPGEALAADAASTLCAYMADRIFEVLAAADLSEETEQLLLAPSLGDVGDIDAVTFGGGVSEFLYRREDQSFGDLGRPLAEALAGRVAELGVEVVELPAGIRSTVTGASQFTVQVSSQTIHTDDAIHLPMRNVPVVAPALDLDDEVDPEKVSRITSAALEVYGFTDPTERLAVGVRWRGSASYSRLQALCRGLAQAMGRHWQDGRPAVVVVDADVAGLIGRQLLEEVDVPVVAIDGVELKHFDYVDIGYVDEALGVIPVVVKSLMFPGAAG